TIGGRGPRPIHYLESNTQSETTAVDLSRHATNNPGWSAVDFEVDSWIERNPPWRRDGRRRTMGLELVWPSLCLAVALMLVITEAFVPSGGIIGLLSLGFLVVSLYLAFTTTSHGWTFVLVTCVLLPIAFAIWAYLWPKTPVAKYLFLKPPEPEDIVADSRGLLLEHLVGQFGRTLTPMRPSG